LANKLDGRLQVSPDLALAEERAIKN
jgi:hypothetical protein